MPLLGFRSGRHATVAAVVAVSLLAAVAGTRLTVGHHRRAASGLVPIEPASALESAQGSAVAVNATPRAGQNAVPTSVPSDAAQIDDRAAVAAAVRYVASTDELMAHSMVVRRDILAKLVAPEVLDAQMTALEATVASFEQARKVSVTRFVWVETPLTATIIETAAPGVVRVGVWSVSIMSQPGSTTAEEAWRTVTVTVHLTAGHWLVTAVTATPGPTPIANVLAVPSPVAEFLTVAAWPPVMAGVGS